LAITLPDGKVQTWEAASREVRGDWAFTLRGAHRVELLGDGPSGPVVVANFPVYVGVDEPAPEGLATPAAPPGPSAAADAPSIEASMLGLLNAARAEAHLKAVERDDALAAVARAHSADMQAHGFFGHVSPTTGTPEDRLRAAHQLYSLFGENVARADSAQHAHDSLMTSPAHRDVMLGAEFTHVGIGAVVVDAQTGERPEVYVTMEFARENPVPLQDVPRRVLEATDMARLPHLLPRLQLDESLDDAARQGLAILASEPAAASKAIEAAKAAAGQARRAAGATCFYLLDVPDVTRLDPPAATKDARAERLGVGAVSDPDEPEGFRVLLIVQAGPRRMLRCE
jgi:uncharacterized protein YkwD